MLIDTEPFARFDEEGLSRLEELSLHRHYVDGEFITCNGDSFPYLMLVKDGAIEAIKESAEGRSLVVLMLTRGEVFWGLTFFDEQALMPVSMRSVGESSLILWSRVDLLPNLMDYSEVLWSLCGLFARRVQRASDIVEDLAFQPVAGRIAKLLLNKFGGKEAKPVARSLTLDEMAARVGTTREMVCRVLYRFSDDELIQITRTDFTLVDESRLAALAGRADNS
jgi:CRP/FNR family transcriptional regulator